MTHLYDHGQSPVSAKHNY